MAVYPTVTLKSGIEINRALAQKIIEILTALKELNPHVFKELVKKAKNTSFTLSYTAIGILNAYKLLSESGFVVSFVKDVINSNVNKDYEIDAAL